MTGTNTSPLIVPPGAKKVRGTTWIKLFSNACMQRALGSNPLCVVAPGKNGDSFTLDMATSVVAYGMVR